MSASKRTKPEPGDIGARIADALKRSGMSQRKLEEKAGLGRGYASRLISGDRGKRFEPDMLLAIADALDEDFLWLATGRRSTPHDRGFYMAALTANALQAVKEREWRPDTIEALAAWSLRHGREHTVAFWRRRLECFESLTADSEQLARLDVDR